MAEFEKGQIFLDLKATNFDHPEGKSKYFLAMNDVNDEDDLIICFSINTEHRLDLYNVGCNAKPKAKYILIPGLHPEIKKHSYMLMNTTCQYSFGELINDSKIKLFNEKLSDEKLRQINNCIDKDSIVVKHLNIIKEAFKIKR